MSIVDMRFALIRDGVPWYPAKLASRSRTTPGPTFRIMRKGLKRYSEATHTARIEAVVTAVLQQGLQAHFAPEGGYSVAIGLDSARVTGWRLDSYLASKLGMEVGADLPSLD